ncbi:MAG: hypothetical protein V1809_16505, partial [Planctomycetota bacterium]
RGLRRKLAGTGLRPILIRTDLKGLRSLGRPAMAVVRHTWFVDHWVVVLEAGDAVHIADPLSGMRQETRPAFERLARGIYVVLAVE